MARRPCFTLQGRGVFNFRHCRWRQEQKTDEPEFAQGRTPSLTTVRNRHLNTSRFRIQNGAAKAQGADAGVTPVLLAAGNGHLDLVQWSKLAQPLIKPMRLLQLPCCSQLTMPNVLRNLHG